MLSERERRVLKAAEAALLEHDAVLVRSFDALARNDPPAEPAPVPRVAEPDGTPEPPAAGGRAATARRARRSGRLPRALFVAGLSGLLVGSGFIFYAGDEQVRMLTCMAVVPVLALVGYALVVRSRPADRDGT